MTTSEIPEDLQDWITKLMRTDLDRMAGAGIQSELMEKKQTLYRQISSENTKLAIEEE
jgi:hypothetical protein